MSTSKLKLSGAISAFPGCGKSFIFKNAEQYGLLPINYKERVMIEDSFVSYYAPTLFDSDSSHFDKDAFPNNYVRHIKEIINSFKDPTIFISSHENVRQALKSNNIQFTLVYPDISLKEEFIERYKERGSPEAFVNLMSNKWEDFIKDCENDHTPNKIILQSGQYLVDVLV